MSFAEDGTGMSDNKSDWDKSFANRDNFVFYPHEEVIRFVSKFIRKRTDLAQFHDVHVDAAGSRILDLGCGIGRHVIYLESMGLDAYGIDLSDVAVQKARDWGKQIGLRDCEDRIKQGDIRALPWNDGFFRYAVSHGVLDSMPFAIARAACIELSRVMPAGGLFYCDLISGDDSNHAREFSGEEIVSTQHEKGTIQLYFNLERIHSLIGGEFSIRECILVRRENVLLGGYTSRYHLVLERL